MSEQIDTTVPKPAGAVATPVTILTALRDGIGALETKALVEGVKPIWDTLEISTEEERREDYSFAGGGNVQVSRWFLLSVLTIDPKEVPE